MSIYKNGKSIAKTWGKIKRNLTNVTKVIKNNYTYWSVTPQFEDSLCITPVGEVPYPFTFRFDSSGWCGKYSTNTLNWESWDSSSSSFNVIVLHEGESLYLVGEYISSLSAKPKIITSGNFSVSGKLLSITAGESYSEVTSLRPYEFCGTFIDSKVADASELILPNIDYSSYCYYKCFFNCEQLTLPPYQLPSTEMGVWCCSLMFGDCDSLTHMPKLNSMSLANYCYQGMFNNCISLTEISRLPATIATSHCYCSMFKGCTSLEIMPDIRLTTGARECCWGMFSGCKSLVYAKDLHMTTSAEWCYEEMFENCTSLITPPDIYLADLSNACCIRMFRGCTSLTTTPLFNTGTANATSVFGEMFYGCTSLKDASGLYLNCEDVKPGSFVRMFYDCKELTKGPSKLLSMESLTYAKNGICYSNMFENCSKLVVSRTKPSTYDIDWYFMSSDEDYYQLVNGMFRGCSGDGASDYPESGVHYYF